MGAFFMPIFKGEKKMFECKHEQEKLMGTADGIVCRACGKLFKDFNEVMEARGETPTEAQEKPKKARSKKA